MEEAAHETQPVDMNACPDILARTPSIKGKHPNQELSALQAVKGKPHSLSGCYHNLPLEQPAPK